MTPDDFKRLVAAGLSTDQIALVMGMMDDARAEARAEVEAVLEQGKEKARARWHRWNEKHRSNVSQREPTFANDSKHSRERVTRVEDKTSNLGIEPQVKNSAPASPSPRQHLETVLDSERAEHVLEHRKRIKAPLTARAAQLLAKDFAKWPDPNEAADEMVKRGWRGFEPSWMPTQRAGPIPSMADIMAQVKERTANGQQFDIEGGGGIGAAVPRLSVVGSR